MPDFDLFDVLARPPHLTNPYVFYAWLRANHPVYLNPDGTAYISRYEYATLLRDPDIRDAPEADSHSHALRILNQTLIKAAPPRHAQLRRAAGTVFDQSRLKHASGPVREVAEHLASQLAATLARHGTADLHTEYSLPFTQRAVAIVFGIPDDDFNTLSTLPARIFQALYPKSTPDRVADADDASRVLLAYMEDAIRHRRFTPGSGFYRMIETAAGIPPDDVTRLCWLLWWGSYTSTLAALDLAALTLIEQPETAPLLHQNTRLWIEEALRYRSPHIINSANLTTRRELTIGNFTLPPHTPIRFLLAAINRDEAVFPHADTFDPHRTSGPHHIAFGEGPHTCVASQLARMELAIALTTLATRLALTLAGQPTWRPYTTQRLCDHLPVAAAETQHHM